MNIAPVKITESVVEETALAWFEELGYTLALGPDISPDGTSCECWVSKII